MSREVKVASLILTPSHIEKNVNSLHEVRWVYGANAILLEQSVIDVSCGQYRQYSIYLKKKKKNLSLMHCSIIWCWKEIFF